MGAGKEAPPKAGAGGGGTEAAEPPQPVVLRMELHCAGCAKKVRKSIHRMPGVVSVVADPAANTVVVAGTADAVALKARIEDKTKKPVQIVSFGTAAGAKPPPAAEPKKTNPDKQGGEEKKNSDKGDKAGASQSQPKQEESKDTKQPPEEKKTIEETTTTTALLRIRLHCDSCADRIKRRIYKIKGVKDVVLEGNAKDEVKVVGTMDVPAMVAYLNDKLNRPVELAPHPAPANKHGGDDGGKKKDKAGGDGDHGHAKKDKAAHREDKGKGVEVVGPSVASAAASLAPTPAGASTHHVSPYGYGHVAYPPPPQGPPPGYYGGGPGYANAGGYYEQPRGDAGAGSYYEQPRGDAGTGSYYQQPRGDYQQPRGDAGGYYDQPRGDAGGYYQQQPREDAGGYYQQQAPPYQQAYPAAYGFDTAPSTRMFSDEDPNAACSVM